MDVVLTIIHHIAWIDVILCGIIFAILYKKTNKFNLKEFFKIKRQ